MHRCGIFFMLSGGLSMNEQVQAYIGKYPDDIIDLFMQLRAIILESAPCAPEETLWARLPSYCIGTSFVRLIPFKDHINIEAKAVLLHKDALADYKITPKGMLQLYLGQAVPCDALRRIFAETLV